MIKKASIVVVSGLILMVAFALLIYPTPYRYMQHKEGDFNYTVRVNTITGNVQALTVDRGWVNTKD